MIQKILRSGNPKLREISRPIIKIDEKALQVIRDLKDTLRIQKDPEGVALAAPQIGKNLRIFVVDYKDFQRVVINPEIIEKSKVKSQKLKVKSNLLEGCLSLPNYYSPLKREPSVKIKYLNEKGEEITEEFRDFQAQIILHEIDHLNGVLFIDRLLKEKKPLYKVEGEEWEEVELV